ncbi:HINT domain-containing protein [Streptomyces sp. NBC_00704]|uniref:polymorphic toxin-type HINT domain-containing protein n=1 Tax=Streptomyces sp. NBC_00704 TaxID=2975809 RepID=UPI002E381718|nr:polymorphic toxin-type HINT domain-containing protein [Streptomyces sp. NBC_00704]
MQFLTRHAGIMEGGKTEPIGEIEVGDKVEAADQKTGKHVGARTVQHVLLNRDYDLLDLTFRGEDGKTATLHTTANHPFWNDSTHAWVPAGDLHRGDTLNTATGHHAYVISARPTPGSANRWNLTVGDLHTYYVLVGAAPVLVHNSCPLNLEAVDDYLHDQIQTVVDAFDKTGKPPAGVMQGGIDVDNVGVYRGHNIPGGGSDKPLGYWTEMDVWPTEAGARRGGMGRIVIGQRGEA